MDLGLDWYMVALRLTQLAAVAYVLVVLVFGYTLVLGNKKVNQYYKNLNNKQD